MVLLSGAFNAMVQYFLYDSFTYVANIAGICWYNIFIIIIIYIIRYNSYIPIISFTYVANIAGIYMFFIVSSDRINVNKLLGLRVRHKCCFSVPFLQVRQWPQINNIWEICNNTYLQIFILHHFWGASSASVATPGFPSKQGRKQYFLIYFTDDLVVINAIIRIYLSWFIWQSVFI